VKNGKIDSWETKKILINSMVESVLLYGSEIWGVGTIDKITAAHLRIFKRLLYLPTNTPAYALLNELNMHPIECQIIKRLLNWWKKLLKTPNNSLVKLCYNRLLEEHNNSTNWISLFKERIFSPELDEIWESQHFRATDEISVINFHNCRSKSEITNKIDMSSSLYWYKELVNFRNQNSDTYLDMDLPKSIINTFAQIRLINIHNEKIYVNGMSYKFFNNELCSICNHHEMDTLEHLLIKCNITKHLREHYLIDTSENLKELLRTGTKENVIKIVNFVKQALRIRSFILNE
jgi:hypothetical protein